MQGDDLQAAIKRVVRKYAYTPRVQYSLKKFKSGVEGYFDQSEGAYVDWLTSELSRPPETVQLIHGEGKSLVLGLATGYSFEDLRPFVLSLRENSECRALLLVDSPVVAELLSAERIDTIVIGNRLGKSFVPHPNIARLGHYLSVLRALRGTYDWVFFADTRDLIFQGDPFESVRRDGSASAFFYEIANEEVFGGNYLNSRWAEEVIGRRGAEVLAGQRIVCGGTVLVESGSVETYLEKKLLMGLGVSEARHRRPGIDQVTTNYIARLGLLPGSAIVPPDRDVVTVGKNRKQLSLRDRLLVKPDGSVPAVVHQYDRDPDLMDGVQLRYRVRKS